jgi:hypothetical protein
MRKSLTFISASAIFLSAASFGCSNPPDVTDQQGNDCTEFSNSSESSCNTQCGIANVEFCEGIAIDNDCDANSAVDVCGVGVPSPKVGGELVELKRSDNVDEYSGVGEPQLGCYSSSGFPAPPTTSELVTMTGVAKIFSSGCESDGLDIAVYTVIRDGSADDGLQDELIGTATVTSDDCLLTGVPEENEDCNDPGFDGNRYECTYSYPDVPTETELMVITGGSGWAPLYEYNLYVYNAEVVDGGYEKDVRALAQDDYTVIPTTTIGKPMDPGKGAVGGEVHDCGNVRLVNAIVNIDKPKGQLAYFTDNEQKPLPDVQAKSTSTLGLYTALDVSPGIVHVAAAGVVNDDLVGVGFFKARVYAGAVTSVTFRGLRPFQLAE